MRFKNMNIKKIAMLILIELIFLFFAFQLNAQNNNEPLPYEIITKDIEGNEHPRTGALSGKTVYLYAGHGIYWDMNYSWQEYRPTDFNNPFYKEDYGTAEFINRYLIPYLENAGANVITTRERDENIYSKTIVISDTDPDNHWKLIKPDDTGFLLDDNPEEKDKYYKGNFYITSTEKNNLTSTTKWGVKKGDLPKGIYALYLWYPMAKNLPESVLAGRALTNDAHYTIEHAYGKTEVKVDQSKHGLIWRYIGSYPVDPNKHFIVTLDNSSSQQGQIVTAGAIRLGGGKLENLHGNVMIVSPDSDYKTPPSVDLINKAIQNYPDEIAKFTECKDNPCIPWWRVCPIYNLQRMPISEDYEPFIIGEQFDNKDYPEIKDWGYEADFPIPSSFAYNPGLYNYIINYKKYLSEFIPKTYPSNLPTFSDLSSRWVRWQHDTIQTEDAIYISWHSNGKDGNSRFTDTYTFPDYFYDEDSPEHILQEYITNYLKDDTSNIKLSDGTVRKVKPEPASDKTLTEISFLENEDVSKRLPGICIEIAFHDNTDDRKLLVDPKFNDTVAHAVYKGIAKYFGGENVTLIPDSPKVDYKGNKNSVTISWKKPANSNIDSYRVYYNYSKDKIDWNPNYKYDEITDFDNLKKDFFLIKNTTLYVWVTAVNAGGESLPTLIKFPGNTVISYNIESTPIYSSYWGPKQYTVKAWSKDVGLDHVTVDGVSRNLSSTAGEIVFIDSFTVPSGQAVFKEYHIYDKAGNVKTISRTFTNYGIEPPDSEHPDDNNSSANPYSSKNELPQGAFFDTRVGVLMKGFYTEASMLIQNAGEKTGLVFTDFDPWETYEQYPVMIIPSGGLYGMDNAESFRTRLEEYTMLGGKIIVFSQQYGKEFGILPGGEVEGYGWQQDISCFDSSLFLSNWHPILSGFNTAYMTSYVDGYFNKFPENSKVILARSVNGQPGAVLYRYPDETSSGWVFVSSIFDDWGTGRGQQNLDTVILLRNLLTWATPSVGDETGDEIPEFPKGQDINLNFKLFNPNSFDASQVTLRIISPERKICGEPQILNITIPAGGSVEVPFAIPLSTLSIPVDTKIGNGLGIWRIDAAFNQYSDNQEPINENYRFHQIAKFIVSEPAAQVNPKGVSLSATAIQSSFLPGTIADFTFHVYNHTDQIRNITIHYGLPHHTWEGGSPGIYGGVYGLIYTLENIQPDEEKTYVWSVPVFTMDRLIAYIEEDGEIFAYTGFPIYKGTAKLDVSITKEKEYAVPERNFNLLINIANNNNFNWDGQLQIQVRTPSGKTFYQSEKKLYKISANGEEEFSESIPISDIKEHGTYQLCISNYNINNTIASYTYDSFLIPNSPVIFEILYPGVLNPGLENNITVNAINSSSFIPVLNGKMELTLKDPSGNTISTLNNEISINPEQSAVLTLPITMPQPRLGSYSFNIKYNDEFSSKEWLEYKESDIFSELSFIKIKNRAGDNLVMHVSTDNKGDFSEKLKINVRIPDTGYSEEQEITLNPGVTTKLDYTASLPETISIGMHTAIVDIIQSSGNVISCSYDFYITAPELKVILNQTEANAGSIIQAGIQNIGGSAAICSYELSFEDNEQRVILNQNGETGTLYTDDVEYLSVTIPGTCRSGQYYIFVKTMDSITGREKKNVFGINVSSIKLEMKTYTDEPIYTNVDPVTVSTDIKTEAGFPKSEAQLHVEIEKASLNIKDIPFLPGYVLKSNNVNFVFIDPSGKKWFGTDKGLSVLDDRNTPFDYSDDLWMTFDKADGLENDKVISMTVDSNGHKWIGTENGLYMLNDNDTLFNKRDDKWHTYFKDENNDSENKIYSVAIDQWNNKWFILNEQKVIVFNEKKNGPSSSSISSIMQKSYSLQQENGQVYIVVDMTTVTGRYVYSHSLKIDNYNTIWIAWTGDKPFEEAPENCICIDAITYEENPFWGGIKSTVRYYSAGDSDENIINSLKETLFTIDKNGTKWAARGNFASVIDEQETPHEPGDDFWHHFTFNIDSTLYSLDDPTTDLPPPNNNNKDNPVKDIVVDDQNNKWLLRGHYLIVFKDDEIPYDWEEYQWNYFPVNNDPSTDAAISSLSIDRYGFKWITTDKGVFLFDDNQTPFDSIDDRWEALSTGKDIQIQVNHIAIDDMKQKWAATSSGVYMIEDRGTLYDLSDDAKMIFQTYDGLLDNNVNCIAIDNNKNKLFATSSGISVLNDNNTPLFKGDDVWSEYTTDEGLSGNEIHCLTIDSTEQKWIATDHGMDVIDTDGDIYHIPQFGNLPSDEVQKILIDSKGVKWCLTPDGLVGFREIGSLEDNNYDWLVYNKEIPELDCSIIHSIFIGNSDELWIGTDNGVKVLDDSENPFNVNDDIWKSLQLTENSVDCTSILEDSKGIMWLGIKGDDKMNMVRYDNKNTPFIIEDDLWKSFYIDKNLTENYITSFAIDDNAVWMGTSKRLYALINETAKVWETDHNISLGNENPIEKEDFPGVLEAIGKYFVSGRLKNSFGQTIAYSRNPFYVVEFGLGLKMDFDKEYYRPGEMINITLTVSNESEVDYIEKRIIVYQDSEIIFDSGVFDLPAEKTISLDVKCNAPLNKKSTNIKVKFMESEIDEDIFIVKPELLLKTGSPSEAGSDAFELIVEITNPTSVSVGTNLVIIPSDNSLETYSTPLTIEKGETVKIEKEYSITKDTDFNIRLLIDGVEYKNENIKVHFAEIGTIQFGTSSSYPEGRITIPYTMNNTGSVPIDFKVDMALLEGASRVWDGRLENIIPVGENKTGYISFDLNPGTYTFTYICTFGNENIVFEVLPGINLNMDVTTQSSQGNYIPITVNITNKGYTNFDGYLTIETPFFNNTESISIENNNGQLSIETKIDLENSLSGTYPAKAIIKNNAGNILKEKEFSISIIDAKIEIKELPEATPLSAGQVQTLSFVLINKGNKSAKAELLLTFGDFEDEANIIWLSGGEEATQDFTFFLPSGLETGEYVAQYKLITDNEVTEGSLVIPVKGIELDVNTHWNKTGYREGEAAILSIEIINNSENDIPPLYLEISYHGVKQKHSFTLPANEQTTINIPLIAYSDENNLVFYGIYDEAENRGIYLNTTYLYPLFDDISIIPEKSLYQPGEILNANIYTSLTGLLAITGPGYNDTLTLEGHDTTISFKLPDDLTRGTYTINYSFEEGKSHSVPFDIDALWIRVTSSELSKSKYSSGENVELSLNIECTENITVGLKGFFVHPDQEKSNAVITEINLLKSKDNHITLTIPLETDQSGLHYLVYQFISPDNHEMIYSSAAEAFDVGKISLLNLTTNKNQYDSKEENIKATLQVYSSDDTNGILELLIDNTSVASSSFEIEKGVHPIELSIPLSTSLSTGIHLLEAVMEVDGLESKINTYFKYEKLLADLVPAKPYVTQKTDNQCTIAVSVYNYGDAASTSTSVDLWEIAPDLNRVKIDSKELTDIASGESMQLEFNWDLSGKTGSYNLEVVVDTENTVIEYSETNNKEISNFIIPFNKSPIANAGDDIIVEATSIDGASVTLDASQSYDPDQDTLSYIWIYSNNYYETINPTISLPLGEHEITLWVYDGESYSEASDTIIVTVRDSTPPVLTVPGDIQIEATGQTTIVEIGEASAIDIFPVVITNNAPDGFPVGTTTVTWTATDANGNNVTGEQKITVTENGIPEGKVIVKFIDSKEQGIKNGIVYCWKYGSFGPKYLGMTDLEGKLLNELKPGRYLFVIYYNGIYSYKWQDTSKDRTVIFQTREVIVKVTDKKGKPLAKAFVQCFGYMHYFQKNIGMTDKDGQIITELLDGSYLFSVNYKWQIEHQFVYIHKNTEVQFTIKDFFIR